MSGSRSSKLSAYQVFSKVTKVSPNPDKKQNAEELKQRRETDPKSMSDSQRKSKSAPKSLIAMANESETQRMKSAPPSKRKDTNSEQQTEGKTRSANNAVQSLLDISFDRPSSQVESQFHHAQRREGKTALLPRPCMMKPHTQLVSSNVHNNKPLMPESVMSSVPRFKPLVVEMKTHEKTSQPYPQPLLDLNFKNALRNKLPNRTDLPQPGQRRSRPELSQFFKDKAETSQGIRDAMQKRQRDESAVVTTSKSETLSDRDKGPSVSKKSRFDESPKLKNRILTCTHKNFRYLIIPSSCSWLHLNGKAKLWVERGTVSIMAFTLQSRVDYEVFSPATGCLLALHVDGSCKISAQDVKSEMTRLCSAEAVDGVLKDLGDNTIAIIRVEELQSGVYDYLTSFIPFTQLFKVSSKEHDKLDRSGVSLVDLGLKVGPQTEMNHTCMQWSPEYNDALEKWAKMVSTWDADRQGPVLLTCGGKNSGKSIVNRCAINVSLQSVQEVAYLDCDVGQTEFSPPATLSLHLIRNPVLGPPFCHQRHAERMVFFGDINMSQDPGFYIRCLQSVFQAYADLSAGKRLPLIVNTMGFPEGVGFMVFIDTMNIVQPDLVIQLESTLQYNNFPVVTQEMVALDEGWTFNKFPPDDPSAKVKEMKAHDLILLSSLACPKRELSFTLKYKPMDLRNLALLSSLCLGLERDATLTSIMPFAVPFHRLAVHVCHHRLSARESLNALDASLVALCEADLSQATKDADDLPWMFEDTPTCQCLGMGIVRAVDLTRGLLVIATTLPWLMLKKVNAVLKGNLTLPDNFFLNQKQTGQTIPYVDALAPSTALTPVRPRARMPRISLGKEQHDL